MRISRINGVGVDISGMYSTLFVAHKDVPGVLAALTNLLAYAHVNIAFCRTYRTEVGGQAYSVFETDGAPDDTVVPMLRKLDNVDYATFIELPGSASSLSPRRLGQGDLRRRRAAARCVRGTGAQHRRRHGRA